MTLYLTVDDVRKLVTMDDALAALDKAFQHWPDKGTQNLERRRLDPPGGGPLNLMAASYPAEGVFGYRAYAIRPAGGSNQVFLFDMKGGPPLAIVESGWASTTRTGAATGIATKYMARANATRLACIGTGRQAVTQVDAVARVRKLDEIVVFSRDKAKRDDFARRMQELTKVKTVGAASARDCVAGADIVITATQSAEPVFFGDWIEKGMHINLIGANSANRREGDDKTILKSDLIVTDHRDQARIEAGEFIEMTASGRLSWEAIHELGDVVTGRVKRTGDDQVTLFKSLGLAYEDVAFCKLILDKAKAKGIGLDVQMNEAPMGARAPVGAST
jgi:ornithine cyclodeaminase/alanine dehydrogenase-like protein (mu-crystallin family)